MTARNASIAIASCLWWGFSLVKYPPALGGARFHVPFEHRREISIRGFSFSEKSARQFRTQDPLPNKEHSEGSALGEKA